MYHRILVAIDFSDPSVEALRWTAERFPDADLFLFHASEEEEPPGYVRQAVGRALDVSTEKELDVRTNLELLADELDRPAEIVIRRGWAPRQVTRAVRDTGAELLVVGAHWKRIWSWDEPGATAEAMADSSPCPVLIWRPGGTRHSREASVVGCLDLREGSSRVAETAATAAEHFDARLVILHVVPGTFQAYLRAVSSPGKVEDSLGKIQASARSEAAGWMPESLKEDLDWRVMVSRGRPVTQILATAESEAADLIVLGRSQRSRPGGRKLMGTVAGKVVRGANCSVLVVPSGE